MSSGNCPYNVLGLQQGASAEEVKKRYRQLARECHPDKNNGQDDGARFKAINDAYNRILNPQQSPQDADDVFRQWFFHGGSPASVFVHTRKQPPPKRVEPHRIDIPLTESDVFYGCTKKLEFESCDVCPGCNGAGYDVQDPAAVAQCTACGGRGATLLPPLLMVQCTVCGGDGKTIQHGCMTCKGNGTVFRRRGYEIKCPKGVTNGHETIMKGKGPFDKASRTCADLVLAFRYSRFSERLRVDGQDVHLDLTVDLNELLRGFKRVLCIYNEQYEVHTDGYVDPSKPHPLRGQGLPAINGGGPSGDILLHLQVRYPASFCDGPEEQADKVNDVQWKLVSPQ